MRTLTVSTLKDPIFAGVQEVSYTLMIAVKVKVNLYYGKTWFVFRQYQLLCF